MTEPLLLAIGAEPRSAPATWTGPRSPVPLVRRRLTEATGARLTFRSGGMASRRPRHPAEWDAEEMDERKAVPLLPVLCSLEAGSGAERLARWQELVARAAEARSRTVGEVRVAFRADEDVRRELAELVESERSCCGFVSWVLHDVGGRLDLVVSGRPSDLDSLPML